MSDDREEGDRPGDDRPGEDRPGKDRPESDRREPLGDLTEEIERRRSRDDDSFEDAFEEVSTGSVDADAVWEELSRDDVEPTAEPAFEPAESGLDSGDRDVRVIDKRSFCQGCRYFSEPPTVACSHEGTTILELVDIGHFRVADCPMVAEAEQLTDELGSDGTE